MPVICIQEMEAGGSEFEASLVYIARQCLKNKKKKQKRTDLL
jgi:hypothetical protein